MFKELCFLANLCVILLIAAFSGCNQPYSRFLTAEDIQKDIIENAVSGDTVCLNDGFDTACVHIIHGKDGKDGKDIKSTHAQVYSVVHHHRPLHEYYYDGDLVTIGVPIYQGENADTIMIDNPPVVTILDPPTVVELPSAGPPILQAPPPKYPPVKGMKLITTGEDLSAASDIQQEHFIDSVNIKEIHISQLGTRAEGYEWTFILNGDEPGVRSEVVFKYQINDSKTIKFQISFMPGSQEASE